MLETERPDISSVKSYAGRLTVASYRATALVASKIFLKKVETLCCNYLDNHKIVEISDVAPAALFRTFEQFDQQIAIR